MLSTQMEGLLEKIDEREEEFAQQFSQTDMYSSTSDNALSSQQ